jgi:hypothetical protein
MQKAMERVKVVVSPGSQRTQFLLKLRWRERPFIVRGLR